MYVESMFDIVAMKKLFGFLSFWTISTTIIFFSSLYLFAKITYIKEMKKKKE